MLCRYVVNFDNIIDIDGEKYLGDFILIPKWIVGKDNKVHPRFVKLYHRIDAMPTDIFPSYVLKKKLSINSDINYFHPATPFNLEKSGCKEWLSWQLVNIPGPSGTMNDEDIVKLIRIKSAIDVKSIDVATTKLCLVIECKFESQSELNWFNWLALATGESTYEKSTQTGESIKMEQENVPQSFIDGKKIKKEKISVGEGFNNGESTSAELKDETVTAGAANEPNANSEQRDVTREFARQKEKRSVPRHSGAQSAYLALKRGKMEHFEGNEDSSSEDERTTTNSWSSNQFLEPNSRPDFRRSV